MTTHGAQTTPETIQLECGPCDRVTTYQRWGAPALFMCQECGTTTGRTEGLTAEQVAEARKREAARKAESASKKEETEALTDEQIEAAVERGNADREGRDVDAPAETTEPVNVEETAEDACRRLARELEAVKRERDSWKLRADAARLLLAAIAPVSRAELADRMERDTAVWLAAVKLAADLRDEVRRG